MLQNNLIVVLCISIEGRKRGKDKAAKKKRGHVTDEEAAEASASDSKGRPHKKHKKTPDSPKDDVTPLDGAAHPSDVLDMPVDPNEPTYCLCHQVSYGEMIGCDNPDVSISNFYIFQLGCLKLIVLALTSNSYMIKINFIFSVLLSGFTLRVWV